MKFYLINVTTSKTNLQIIADDCVKPMKISPDDQQASDKTTISDDNYWTPVSTADDFANTFSPATSDDTVVSLTTSFSTTYPEGVDIRAISLETTSDERKNPKPLTVRVGYATASLPFTLVDDLKELIANSTTDLPNVLKKVSEIRVYVASTREDLRVKVTFIKACEGMYPGVTQDLFLLG